MSPRAAVALILAGVVAGCATEPPADTPGEVYAGPVYAADPAAGRWAVAALGTPFYIAFKAAVCAGSLAIAAPTSALIAVSGPQAREEGLSVLGAGVAQNCGPPYVLAP